MSSKASRAFLPVACFLLVIGFQWPASYAGEPTLYIIRAPSVSMSGMNVEISIDGLPNSMVGPNGCSVLAPAPNTKTIRYRWRAGALGNSNLETEFVSVPISLEPKKASYLRLMSKTDTIVNARGGIDVMTTWKLEQVQEAEVKSYLPRCNGRALHAAGAT